MVALENFKGGKWRPTRRCSGRGHHRAAPLSFFRYSSSLRSVRQPETAGDVVYLFTISNKDNDVLEKD